MASSTTRNVIRDVFRAWETGDRALLEPLLTDDFTFTSPNAGDDHLNKAEYFERCWISSDEISAMDILALIEDGDEAFVRYLATLKNGKQFINTEYFTLKDGKIASVDVYFGRNQN